MRFVVTSGGGTASNATTTTRARVGALYTSPSASPVPTPALLLATRKGLPSFIPPDLLPSLRSRLLHLSPLHFFDIPSAKTFSAVGGIHRMVGLSDHIFFASPRDSVECLPQHDGANKIGASFETPTGRRMVKPSAYMELVSALKPDVFVSLADEVPAWVTEKRNILSVDRTLRWLDDCLGLDKQHGATILGSVVGGSSIEERKRCATGVAMRNVSGLLAKGKVAPDIWTCSSRKDTSPIVKNCTCFTCQNHTRAYINHLINVHEMLAQTLLEIHNTHHYLEFFRSIRKAIKAGKFDLFCQRFMDSRRAHVTSAMA